MTISSTTRKAGPFIGNGSASSFPFTFKVFQASDLLVVQLDTTFDVESTLVLNTNYTVSLNANQNTNPGGTVTLSAGALAAGYTLTITSDIDNLQPTDLTNQGGFYPTVINDALDRATIQIQQLQVESDRSIKVPVSSTVGTNLPTPQANDLLGWNGDASALVNVDPGTLATVAAYATAYADTFTADGSTVNWTLTRDPATINNLDVSIDGVTQVPNVDYTLSGTTFSTTSTIPSGRVILVKYREGLPNTSGDSQDFRYLPAGTGAVATTVQAKLRESVSVKDFGAVGDGVTDDTAAIQTAVTYALQNELSLNFDSSDIYKITSEINFPKFHSGVIRKWISFNGNDCTILLDGSNFTGFGYTYAGGGGLFDNANYFLIFENFNFKSTQGNGVIAIRPAGFITSKYINLKFEAVDYPFFQQTSDPRNTPNYVQSAHLEGCYSIQHRRFWAGTQVYDFRMIRTFVDTGVDGLWIDRGAAGQSGYVCDISGSAFQSHSGVAVLLGGMTGLSLTKNYFENNAKEVLLTGTITQSDGGVYWEYIAATTAWTTGASIADSGTYRVNANNLYVSSTIGITGATAPTHTSGTVSDGGVDWTFVGSYSAWASGQAISNFGEFRSNASKVYRSATTGTTGATAPTHNNGTVFNYGGSIENNFNQPKGTPASGYRGFIELAENPSSGFKLGGNVDQARNTLVFNRFSQGMFNTLGDRFRALEAANLYDATLRPDDAKAVFSDAFRFGAVFGNLGGMVMNLQSRGMEYTNAEYDYFDPVTNLRVPIVIGVAQVTPPGFGPTGAFPPSAYPTIYPQKPWARGSFLSNPTPTVTGTAGSQYIIQGWMCTASGTPGTWVECRTLTGT